MSCRGGGLAFEVEEAENLMRREGIRSINSTSKSIEEIATTILRDAGVTVLPDSSATWRGAVRGVRVTQPWWLSYGRRGDLFDVPRSAGGLVACPNQT